MSVAPNLPSIDHIYCINLESSKDRRAHMKKLFKKHNFHGVFIRAIHPRHKDYVDTIRHPKKVENISSAQRCHCVDRCDHKTRKLRPTEIAISLSHYHAYRKMLKHEDYWALICEDDIKLINNFSEIVNYVIPIDIWESTEPIIINCGGATDNYGLRIKDISRFKFWNLPIGSFSNYCYLINHEAAKILLKNFFPIKKPEDSYKRWLIGKGHIKCYRIAPSIVAELSAGRNAMPVWNRLSHMRVPDTTIEKIKDNIPLNTDIKSKTKRVFSNKISSVEGGNKVIDPFYEKKLAKQQKQAKREYFEKKRLEKQRLIAKKQKESLKEIAKRKKLKKK